MIENLRSNAFFNLSLNVEALSHEEYFQSVSENEQILSDSSTPAVIRMNIADKLEALSKTYDNTFYFALRSVKKIGQFLTGGNYLNSADFSRELVSKLRDANRAIFTAKVNQMHNDILLCREYARWSDDEIITVIDESVRYGYISELKLIVSVTPFIHDIDINIILNAAKLGRFDCFNVLAKHYRIEDFVFAEVLYYALANEHLTFIKKVLDEFTISNDIRLMAFAMAVHYDDPFSLRRLFLTLFIDDHSKTNLLERAAELNHVRCIEIIYDNSARIFAGNALLKAASKGNFESVRLIVSLGLAGIASNPDLATRYLIISINSSIIKGHVDCLSWLINYFCPSDLDLMNFLEIGLRTRQLNSIQELLRHPRVTNMVAGLVFCSAASKQYIEAMDVIVNNHVVDLVYLEQALDDAFYNRCFESIRFIGRYIVRQYGMNEQIFGDLIQAQVIQGALDVHSDNRDKKTHLAWKLLVDHQKDRILPVDLCTKAFCDYLEKNCDERKKSRVLDALMGPDRQEEWPSLLENHFQIPGIEEKICGNQVFTRFWTFIDAIKDPVDQENSKRSLVQALSSSIEDGKRVCNPGRLQRMVVAILSGRLEGVSLDAEHEINAAEALNMFFSISQHTRIDQMQDLMQAVDRFIELNPLIPKEEFLIEILEYARISGFQ